MPFPGSERWRAERLKREVVALEDRPLVQRGFDEFWRVYGMDGSIDSRTREDMLQTIRLGEAQLKERGGLEMEVRGRIRSILLGAFKRR